MSSGYSAVSAASSSRSLFAPPTRSNVLYSVGVQYDAEGEREGWGDNDSNRKYNSDNNNNNSANNQNMNNSNNSDYTNSKITNNKISELFNNQNHDNTLLLFEEKKENNTTVDIFSEISSIKSTKNAEKIDQKHSKSDFSMMKILETKSTRERKSVHLIPFLRNTFSSCASDLPPPLLLRHVLVSTVHCVIRSTSQSDFIFYVFIYSYIYLFDTTRFEIESNFYFIFIHLFIYLFVCLFADSFIT